MIKTIFYTFLQTKHEEETNHPLYAQEIEIRPITQIHWEILKILTIDELWTGGKFDFPLEKIQGMLKSFSPEAMSRLSRTNQEVCSIKVTVKDLDTNTYHSVAMWKYPHEGYFAMRESWIQEFVRRRRLVNGMLVGMYWDAKAKMFCFSVLDGSDSE